MHRPRPSLRPQDRTANAGPVRATRVRPWAEVARLYAERTGETITARTAQWLAETAERKLRAALRADPDLRAIRQRPVPERKDR